MPEGWVEIAPGAYVRSALGAVTIIQQAVPGVGADQLLQMLVTQLGSGEAPGSAGSREANGLTWKVYEVEVQGLSIDIALAEDGGGTSYLIMLQNTASKRDLYYTEVYLPAIDALTPASE